MRKSKLTDEEIAEMYTDGKRINDIASAAGISRQAVNNTLRRIGVHNPRRGTISKVCLFCGETYTVFKCHDNDRPYCSRECYHADRSITGVYSPFGCGLSSLERATSRKLGRVARKALAESGVLLQDGQVIHHINGNRSDNRPENLQVFNSHSEHMKFHHQIRHSRIERRTTTAR